MKGLPEEQWLCSCKIISKNARVWTTTTFNKYFMVSLPFIQHFCPSNFRCPNMLPRLLLRCPGSITQHEPILHSEAAVTPLEHKCGTHGTPACSSFSGPSLIQVQVLHRFTATFSNYTTATSSYTVASSPVTLQPPSVTLQPSPQLRYSHSFWLSPQDTYPHQPVSASPVSPHLPAWLTPSFLLILLPFCSLPYLLSSLPLKIYFSLMPRSNLMSLGNPFKIP